MSSFSVLKQLSTGTRKSLIKAFCRDESREGLTVCGETAAKEKEGGSQCRGELDTLARLSGDSCSVGDEVSGMMRKSAPPRRMGRSRPA